MINWNRCYRGTTFSENNVDYTPQTVSVIGIVPPSLAGGNAT